MGEANDLQGIQASLLWRASVVAYSYKFQTCLDSAYVLNFSFFS
jgi:hypothetical protein